MKPQENSHAFLLALNEEVAGREPEEISEVPGPPAS